MTNGGRILVEALDAHEVDTVFCVAGESYLPVLDALLDYPEIKVITCRHESGAAFMAEAYGQLTGKPGIALVTRGPGACNASIGIHAARQSSTPVILFAGLIATGDRDKDAFQEFDIAGMFGSLSKWSSVIDQGARIGEYVSRAFNEALTGRPGPVVLGLPEDVLFGAAEKRPVRPVPNSDLYSRREEVEAVAKLLGGAKKPVVIVGGTWSDATCAAFEDFAALNDLPVAAALRRQDIFSHEHPCYAGELGFGPNPKLVQRIKEADIVLALGTRLDEITLQGYTLLDHGQKLIHAYPDPAEFGRACIPELAIKAHSAHLVEALAERDIGAGRWKKWREAARADCETWTAIEEKDDDSGWNGADMTQVFRHLRDFLPHDAVVTTDAGNFSGWAQRYLRYGRPGRALAPVSGAMGYGVPSAVAAAIRYPERLALGICGDGGFMMTASELATALHHGAKPVIMICNNGVYGTIRMHQERDFPGRPSATALTNPDFVRMGKSYGMFAARVEKAADFPAVWRNALKSGKAALIEIRQDPRQVSTTTKA